MQLFTVSKKKKKTEADEENCDQVDTAQRCLHVSRIFRKTENSTLVRAIASAVFKMLRSDVHPFSTPFEKLDQRTFLKFVKGSEKRVVWTTLKDVAAKWNSVAAPSKVLVRSLRLGTRG